jgi:hypothetical protein
MAAAAASFNSVAWLSLLLLLCCVCVQVYFTVYGRLKTTLTTRPNGEHGSSSCVPSTHGAGPHTSHQPVTHNARHSPASAGKTAAPCQAAAGTTAAGSVLVGIAPPPALLLAHP